MTSISKPVKKALLKVTISAPLIGLSYSYYQGHKDLIKYDLKRKEYYWNSIKDEFRKLTAEKSSIFEENSLVKEISDVIKANVPINFEKMEMSHKIGFAVILGSILMTGRSRMNKGNKGLNDHLKSFYHNYYNSKSSSAMKLLPTLFRKGFTHMGPFHLFFNCYILYQIMDLSVEPYFSALSENKYNWFRKVRFDNTVVTSLLLGIVLSTSLSRLSLIKKPQIMIMGISGGVYSVLGYHYNYADDYPQFKLIFDIRENPSSFGLADFQKIVYVEAAIAALQLSSLRIANSWPVGHLAHVSGYLLGVLMKQCYMHGREGTFFKEVESIRESFRKVLKLFGKEDRVKSSDFYGRQN